MSNNGLLLLSGRPFIVNVEPEGFFAPAVQAQPAQERSSTLYRILKPQGQIKTKRPTSDC